jgi:hypothetical protein
MARARNLPSPIWIINVALRVAIVGFAIEALIAGDDPRFVAKGIATRDLILAAATVTLLAPAVHAWRRRARPYPIWADTLLVSMIALDMAGNSLNLYAQPWRFDLIPHAYGPAASLAALRLLGIGWLPAILTVNGVHVLLEAQEALGDVLFGTRNVNGWWDTMTDLAAGLTGTVVVVLAFRGRWTRRRSPSLRADASRRTDQLTQRAASRLPLHVIDLDQQR